MGLWTLGGRFDVPYLASCRHPIHHQQEEAMTAIYLHLMTMGERLSQRVGDERGQTAAEYLGIIVLVAAIIAGLFATDLGDKILTGITDSIDEILDNAF